MSEAHEANASPYRKAHPRGMGDIIAVHLGDFVGISGEPGMLIAE
jgi:hypothetical protein